MAPASAALRPKSAWVISAFLSDGKLRNQPGFFNTRINHLRNPRPVGSFKRRSFVAMGDMNYGCPIFAEETRPFISALATTNYQASLSLLEVQN